MSLVKRASDLFHFSCFAPSVSSGPGTTSFGFFFKKILVSLPLFSTRQKVCEASLSVSLFCCFYVFIQQLPRFGPLVANWQENILSLVAMSETLSGKSLSNCICILFYFYLIFYFYPCTHMCFTWNSLKTLH